MTARTTDVVLADLVFPEGPRWRDGRLVLSDVFAGEVLSMAPDGSDVQVVCRVDGLPSGLGWDTDGRLLVAAVRDRHLLRLEADGSLATVADLSGVTRATINDMVVDARGRAYVGDMGFALGSDTPAPGQVVLVDTSVEAPEPRVVDGDVMFPNGSVVTPDGRTLIVGETFGGRLTAFDVADDGSLTGRRLWAELPAGAVPDGACLDAEGCVWTASPTTDECLRLREGGEVVDRVSTGDLGAYACMLGGDDRRTLYVCTNRSFDPVTAGAQRAGRVEAVVVDVPGAGLP